MDIALFMGRTRLDLDLLSLRVSGTGVLEMTPQSRRTSLLEAATQSLVGLPLGFAVVTAVSLLRLSPAAAGALSAGLMFVVSTARGYVIRRRFAKMDMVTAEWQRMIEAHVVHNKDGAAE